MYQQVIGDLQYLMEDVTKLPRVTFLELVVMSNGQAFGASSFHVMKLCTGIRKLSLVLHTHIDSEVKIYLFTLIAVYKAICMPSAPIWHSESFLGLAMINLLSLCNTLREIFPRAEFFLSLFFWYGTSWLDL
jgi:hypothetical protein